MTDRFHEKLLRNLPSIDSLLREPPARRWLADHPRALVVGCIRETVDDLRRQILEDRAGQCGPQHVSAEYVLDRAGRLLAERTQPHVRPAINATGVILHTALGRAVWPERVVESTGRDLAGYVTLAIDRRSGTRSERHHRIEYLLTELTGAEAATVVNNNAGATLLVLAALGAGGETIVSRGQLIEIGGAFRLPDVMSASGTTMVEVGTTNRTHLRDYEGAITDQTALLFRAHPSNFRVVGFSKEVPIAQLAELAHRYGLAAVDDLGAGALVDLERFDLPHEPTVSESLADGADVALFSADKLIGGPQGGIIVGRAESIERIRRHPLARALRVDKTCLMALERTLMLFRDLDLLVREHPLYRMLTTPMNALADRARRLADAVTHAAPCMTADVVDSQAYLGSGSLPDRPLPSLAVAVTGQFLRADRLAEALRMDEACIFSRVERDAVCLDVRTLWDHEVDTIAQACARICAAAREQT